MRHSLLIIALLMLPLAVMAQRNKPAKPGTKAYLEEKAGFKNIILGQDILSLQDAVVERDREGNLVIYDVVDKSMLSVGSDIQLESIQVGTYNDQIMSVHIKMQKPNGRKLHDVFKEAYGAPFQSNRYIDKYLWSSDNILLSVDYDGMGEDVALLMHRGIYDESEKEAKKANIKAVDDI